MNKISQEENKTVEDIIQEVSEGNLTWIDKISYFNGQVKALGQRKWKFTHGLIITSKRTTDHQHFL